MDLLVCLLHWYLINFLTRDELTKVMKNNGLFWLLLPSGGRISSMSAAKKCISLLKVAIFVYLTYILYILWTRRFHNQAI